MHAVALCVYCEQLPERRHGHAARVMRCPLCHAGLGITARGAKFRIAEENVEHRPGPGRAMLLAVITMFLFVAGAATLWMLLQRPGAREQQPQPLANPSLAAVSAHEGAVETSPAEAVPEAVSQPHNAAVKAFAPPWRYRLQAKSSPYPVKEAALLPQAMSTVAIREPRLNPESWASYDSTLLHLLHNTPELSLHQQFPKSLTKNEARERILKSLKDALEVNQKAKEPDAFVRNLMETRPDLHGLPFLLGKACRLEPRTATQLAVAAAMVRSPGRSIGSRTLPTKQQQPYPFAAFWHQWTDPRLVATTAEILVRGDIANRSAWDIDDAHVQTGILALNQILIGEESPVRKGLVVNLGAKENAQATKSLVKLAVFDPDHEVRELALIGLSQRHSQEYCSQLAEAIRLPWAPAARHAAAAIVRLNAKQAIPSLINFLDEPDPAAAVRAREEAQRLRGPRVGSHQPQSQLSALPRGRGQERPLRPRSGRGHGPEPRGTAAALDKPAILWFPRQWRPHGSGGHNLPAQDFSALLTVADPGPWPAKQRFDFLVRTRVLSKAEAAEQLAQTEPGATSPQHQAALAALRDLTGQDFGPSAEAWRRQYGGATSARAANKPAW